MSPREDIAEQQAALVRALVAGGAVPEGLNAAHVARAARSLIGKRRREVARAWPALARCLGAEYRTLFEAYAHSAPLPEGGPLADGRTFARTVAGRLDDEARREVRARGPWWARWWG